MAINEKNEKQIDMFVDGNALEKYATGEVYQRLSSSSTVIMHNSTEGNGKLFSLGVGRSFHEMILSKDEKEELKKEQERIRSKVKRFAKDHTGELSGLLGKLSDKYEVELTVFDGFFRNSVPLGINLKDRSIEVPLDDWGAGTQNRTKVMMSILAASRIKQQTNDENRVTPILIIEEPESFLHPSAQAEFGRVLRGLARDLQIQVIITTHSPYMLCQERPESNVLLDRKSFRGRLKETYVVEVDAQRWMEPFGDILGLNDETLKPWKEVIEARKDHAVLVEGSIDKEYLEYIASLNIRGFDLPAGVEIIPYGGKDALKNSIMLKFVIEKFDRVFITFDLDAESELKRIMGQLSLQEETDFLAVGVSEDGKDCIEGLLPDRVLAAVYSANTDLVMKLGAADANKRRSAKSELKGKLLKEFKASREYSVSDLKAFKPLFSAVKRAFSTTQSNGSNG